VLAAIEPTTFQLLVRRATISAAETTISRLSRAYPALARLSCYYPCDAMLVRVFATAACPSVRPSAKSRYCVNTKSAIVMISSPSGSPTILVFWCQISSQNSKRSPQARASNKEGVGKTRHFLTLNVNILKTVADTAKVPIND